MAKMTDEAKARLREAAARKREEAAGRTSLKGLDRTTGLVALDWVQEHQAELPDARIHNDGSVAVELSSGGWLTASDEEDYYVRVSVYRKSGDKLTRWCHLRYCPDWVGEEFARRFVHRKVMLRKFAGPGNPAVLTTVTAVPVKLAVAWLKFIWPEEWGGRVKKYVVGITDAFSKFRPGVGARVMIWNGGKKMGPATVLEWFQVTYGSPGNRVHLKVEFDEAQRGVKVEPGEEGEAGVFPGQGKIASFNTNGPHTWSLLEE